MGLLQNPNMTFGFSQNDVSHWESVPQLSSGAVKNTIVMLGVLTFVLQLCLVLFLMLRYWRLDKNVQEAAKHLNAELELWTAPTVIQYQSHKERNHLILDDEAPPLPAVYADNEEYQPATNYSFGPSMPWDLVQY